MVVEPAATPPPPPPPPQPTNISDNTHVKNMNRFIKNSFDTCYFLFTKTTIFKKCLLISSLIHLAFLSGIFLSFMPLQAPVAGVQITARLQTQPPSSVTPIERVSPTLKTSETDDFVDQKVSEDTPASIVEDSALRGARGLFTRHLRKHASTPRSMNPSMSPCQLSTDNTECLTSEFDRLPALSQSESP